MGFLKFVGMVNAAIWLGACVSLTLVILPFAVFSKEMQQLLGNVPGYPGAVAILIFSRFFILQYACGFIAIAHSIAGWLYLGRPLRNFTNYVLLCVCGLGLVAGLWFQPRIRDLHFLKYGTRSTPAQRDAAARTLGVYHATAETLNLVALAGLAVYFWRVAHPNDPARFASLNKFRS